MINLLLAETKPLLEDPMTYILIAVIAIFGVLVYMQSKRRKAMQAEVEKMHDGLRPGMRVRTVGGIVGRIKEIREEAPGTKTMLLQTGNDKFSSYMLFDIGAVYCVVAEEGHNLDGSPIIKSADKNIANDTVVNKNVTDKSVDNEKGSSEGVITQVDDDFDAREYVDKRNNTAKSHKKA